MPPIPSAILSGLTLALLATWVIFYASLVRRLPNMLPEPPGGAAGPVPWSGRTVLLVVIAWFVISLSTPTTYILLRDRIRGRTVGAVVAQKSESEELRPAIPSVSVLTDRTNSPALKLHGNSGRRGDKPILSFFEKIALVSVVNGLLLVAIPLLLRLDSHSVRKHLGLARPDRNRGLRTGAVAFLVITPVVFAINLVALQIWRKQEHPLELMLRKELGPGTAALACLSAMVLAPAAEELLFRGVIQAWLRKVWELHHRPHVVADRLLDETAERVEPLSAPAISASDSSFRVLPRPVRLLTDRIFRPPSAGQFSIVLTSVLFALLHADQMPAPFAIFALSLMLGWLYERTGGVMSSFVLHALFNGFNTALMLFGLLFTPPTSPPPALPKVPPVGAEKSVENRDFSLSCLACDDTFWSHGILQPGQQLLPIWGRPTSTRQPCGSGSDDSRSPVVSNSTRREDGLTFLRGGVHHGPPAPTPRGLGAEMGRGPSPVRSLVGLESPSQTRPDIEGFRSMSEANSTKNATTHTPFEWAGAVARIRRGGKSLRSGRRSALLSMLTSSYGNSSRGGRPVEVRGNSDRS